MDNIADLLARSLARVEPKRAARFAVELRWPELAGPMLAAHSRPRVAGKLLIIEVDDERWRLPLHRNTRPSLTPLEAGHADIWSTEGEPALVGNVASCGIYFFFFFFFGVISIGSFLPPVAAIFSVRVPVNRFFFAVFFFFFAFQA